MFKLILQRGHFPTVSVKSFPGSLFKSAPSLIHAHDNVNIVAIQQRDMASKRHKEVLRQTKGYRGRAKNCFTIAIRRLQKAMQHAYRDRKQKKRDMRKLWIQRVGAASRQHGIPYREFIPALNNVNIALNRKVLADIAATEPYSFRAVVDTVRTNAK